MYQHMTHTLNIVPIYLLMALTIIQSQFIDSFTDNFYMFDQTKIDNGVSQCFFQRMVILVVDKHISGFQYVTKSLDVSNFLSHISVACHD